MPREPTLLVLSGIASIVVFVALTIHSPGQVEAVQLHALCAGTGAFLAGAASAIIFKRKEHENFMFGKKKENGISWEDRVKPNNGAEEKTEGGSPLANQEQPKTILPGKMAIEAAAALSGIKALIDSIQVTDQETWAAVAKNAKQVQEALGDMETSLSSAIEASKKARAALDELVAVVGDR